MKGRLALALLLPAAVAALWYLVHVPRPGEPVRAFDREVPENSYMQARYRMRDSQGELLYEVATARLDQFAESRILSLDRPRLRWLNPDFRNSSASARSGKIEKFRVTLIEDVMLRLTSLEHSPALIRSDFLVLDEEGRRIHTDQAVVVSQAHSVLRGTGLNYQVDGSGGRLDDVHVRQIPSSRQKPTQMLLERILEEAFSAAYAEEEDALDLTAERMEWDAQEKTSVYYGDVRATQGDMTLTADKLTVHSDGAKVQSLHAEGNAHWTQTLGSGKPLRADAGSISYQVSTRKVVLKQDVDLRVGAHQFTGEEVTYLLDEERLETPVAGEPSERVHLRLDMGSEPPP